MTSCDADHAACWGICSREKGCYKSRFLECCDRITERLILVKPKAGPPGEYGKCECKDKRNMTKNKKGKCVCKKNMWIPKFELSEKCECKAGLPRPKFCLPNGSINEGSKSRCCSGHKTGSHCSCRPNGSENPGSKDLCCSKHIDYPIDPKNHPTCNSCLASHTYHPGSASRCCSGIKIDGGLFCQ